MTDSAAGYLYMEVRLPQLRLDKLLIVGSAYVTSNGEWIAKCILQGFFNAPIEALPEISVTDVVRASGCRRSHAHLT